MNSIIDREAANVNSGSQFVQFFSFYSRNELLSELVHGFFC